VVRDCHAPPISVLIALMAAALPFQFESIGKQRANNLARGQGPQPRVIDHSDFLNGDGDPRTFKNLYIGGRCCWKGFTFFKEFVHDHLDHFIDVLQSFLLSRSLRDGAVLTKRGTEGVITAFVGLDDDSEAVGLHSRKCFQPECRSSRVSGQSSYCSSPGLGSGLPELAFDFFQPVRALQDFAGFAAVGRADDAFALHYVQNSGCAAIA